MQELSQEEQYLLSNLVPGVSFSLKQISWILAAQNKTSGMLPRARDVNPVKAKKILEGLISRGLIEQAEEPTRIKLQRSRAGTLHGTPRHGEILIESHTQPFQLDPGPWYRMTQTGVSASKHFIEAHRPRRDLALSPGAPKPSVRSETADSLTPQTGRLAATRETPGETEEGAPSPPPSEPRTKTETIRERIISLLREHPEGLQGSTMVDMLGSSRNTVFKALKKLCYTGEITKEARGRKVFYVLTIR